MGRKRNPPPEDGPSPQGPHEGREGLPMNLDERKPGRVFPEVGALRTSPEEFVGFSPAGFSSFLKGVFVHFVLR